MEKFVYETNIYTLRSTIELRFREGNRTSGAHLILYNLILLVVRLVGARIRNYMDDDCPYWSR